MLLYTALQAEGGRKDWFVIAVIAVVACVVIYNLLPDSVAKWFRPEDEQSRPTVHSSQPSQEPQQMSSAPVPTGENPLTVLRRARREAASAAGEQDAAARHTEANPLAGIRRAGRESAPVQHTEANPMARIRREQRAREEAVNQNHHDTEQ